MQSGFIQQQLAFLYSSVNTNRFVLPIHAGQHHPMRRERFSIVRIDAQGTLELLLRFRQTPLSRQQKPQIDRCLARAGWQRSNCRRFMHTRS